MRAHVRSRERARERRAAGRRLGLGPRAGASDDDTENLINIVRNLDTVKIAIFLKERPDGLVKISLRSKNHVNVADVARRFGGGGHAYAAGAVTQGPLQKALPAVVAACQDAL